MDTFATQMVDIFSYGIPCIQTFFEKDEVNSWINIFMCGSHIVYIMNKSQMREVKAYTCNII